MNVLELVFLSLFSVFAHAEALPDRVYFKTRTESLTHQYALALREGRIWYRPIGQKTQWALLQKTGLPINSAWVNRFTEPTSIQEISADGDNLIAIDADRHVYYMKFSTMEWTRLWGKTVFPPKPWAYFSSTIDLPVNRAWAISHRGDFVKGFVDPKGEQFPVSAGVTSLYYIDPTGLEIRYGDPWLPPDFNRTIGRPGRGTVIIHAMDASGSSLFVMNKKGQMFTRLADYDSMGFNPFLKYTYNPKDFGNDRRLLPPEQWRSQPDLPEGARATGRISILSTGGWNNARELRAEAVNAANEYGFFWKSISAPDWNFRKIADGLVPADLAFLPEQVSEKEIQTASIDQNFSGLLSMHDDAIFSSGIEVPVDVLDFNTAERSARVVFKLGHERYELPMYLYRLNWDDSGPDDQWKAVLVQPEKAAWEKGLTPVNEILFKKRKEVKLRIVIGNQRLNIALDKLAVSEKCEGYLPQM